MGHGPFLSCLLTSDLKALCTHLYTAFSNLWNVRPEGSGVRRLSKRTVSQQETLPCRHRVALHCLCSFGLFFLVYFLCKSVCSRYQLTFRKADIISLVRRRRQTQRWQALWVPYGDSSSSAECHSIKGFAGLSAFHCNSV